MSFVSRTHVLRVPSRTRVPQPLDGRAAAYSVQRCTVQYRCLVHDVWYRCCRQAPMQYCVCVAAHTAAKDMPAPATNGSNALPADSTSTQGVQHKGAIRRPCMLPAVIPLRLAPAVQCDAPRPHEMLRPRPTAYPMCYAAQLLPRAPRPTTSKCPKPHCQTRSLRLLPLQLLNAFPVCLHAPHVRLTSAPE